jgi:7-carboxy-7-deazaguanine synthase
VDGKRFDREQSTLELDPVEAAGWVRRFACLRVVLTGGEPLLQTAECASLARALREFDARYVFEVETNGTLVPSVELDALVEQYTVSPKLEHAGIERSLRLRDAPLSYFAASPKSVFKFVVRDRADAAEVQGLARSYDIEPARIYLMPLGTTSSALNARSPEVAAACLDHGYRFSDRLHIHLFGNRPGV